MNESTAAYSELESLASAAFERHGVSFFSDLPVSERDILLQKQDAVLKQYSLTRDDFLADSTFIAAD